MLGAPQIVQTALQLTASVPLSIPREAIQSVMGPAIGELMAVLAAQKIAPTGPLFSHHFRMDPQRFDFEIGAPVATTVAAAGRVRPGQLPAATVARAVYHGGYDGLGAAWGQLGAWIAEQGLSPAENLWEVYVAGPESSPDPRNWRTELNRPLTGDAPKA